MLKVCAPIFPIAVRSPTLLPKYQADHVCVCVCAETYSFR